VAFTVTATAVAADAGVAPRTGVRKITGSAPRSKVAVLLDDMRDLLGESVDTEPDRLLQRRIITSVDVVNRDAGFATQVETRWTGRSARLRTSRAVAH
jgi:hypothetical protein